MKRIFLVLALSFSASLPAQAPAPLAHGNVPGEPHHHLKIENEYVRAYYVEVAPHESTQLHQHDNDYLFVTLGDSEVVNAVLGKPEAHLSLKDGETHFTRGGFAHIARNLSDTPFRNITIELLHSQGEAHNTCGFVIPGQVAAVCDPPPGSYWADTQFESTEVRLDLVWLFANGKHTETTSKLAFLVVGLGGPQVRISAKGESSKILRQGEVEWFDAGSVVQFSREGTEVARFLKLTLKDSALRSKP
jgi:quercetin dioxygenase-like cupin family protein